MAPRLEVGIETSLRSVAPEVPSRLLISTDSPLVDEPRFSSSVGASGRVDDEGPADDSPVDVGALEAMAHGSSECSRGEVRVPAIPDAVEACFWREISWA